MSLGEPQMRADEGWWFRVFLMSLYARCSPGQSKPKLHLQVSRYADIYQLVQNVAQHALRPLLSTITLQLFLEAGLQPPLNSIEVFVCCDPAAPVLLAACKRKILGHDAINIDGVNAGLLELLGEDNELGGVVELTTLSKALCPSVDRGDGVGGGFVTLLVLAVVTGDCAVGGLSLEGLAIGRDEDGGHEAEGAETLGDNVGLNISVIV
jgi:hypothetical protein